MQIMYKDPRVVLKPERRAIDIVIGILRNGVITVSRGAYSGNYIFYLPCEGRKNSASKSRTENNSGLVVTKDAVIFRGVAIFRTTT